ncbi:MAG: hypothetical protein WDN06_11195 [Asticcacaulis sp.]
MAAERGMQATAQDAGHTGKLRDQIKELRVDFIEQTRLDAGRCFNQAHKQGLPIF